MKKLTIVLALALCVLSLHAETKFSWVDSVSDDTDKMLPGVDPSKVKGDVIVSGSSTVFPLSVAIAESFKKEGYKGNVSLDSIGTGGGMERFTKGEVDIAAASRTIKSSEADAARKAGREPLEFRIGSDAITVCVSKKNTFVTGLTKAELALLFSTAQYWSDVRSNFPKKEILRYTPGTDSGTFDYFVEHVFAKNKKPLLEAKNLNMSEDDNVLVQGVEGSEYAVGFFGFAYFVENKAKMTALALDGVAASSATVDAGTYQLSRPLFLYTTAKILRDKPQVAAFVDYYLTSVNRLIKKVGYFPAPDAALKKSKQGFVDSVKGLF